MSAAGAETLVLRVLKEGIRVPKAPSTNVFNGKNVLKATIRQKDPPDPKLVLDKGTNNFGRQMGIRFMSGCKRKSDNSSRCASATSDNSSRYTSANESVASAISPFIPTTRENYLAGLEIECKVVTPES
ncbi:MAG: hypothetical protein SGARI_007385, partial [Bacillariaceae sp.]